MHHTCIRVHDCARSSVNRPAYSGIPRVVHRIIIPDMDTLNTVQVSGCCTVHHPYACVHGRTLHTSWLWTVALGVPCAFVFCHATVTNTSLMNSHSPHRALHTSWLLTVTTSVPHAFVARYAKGTFKYLMNSYSPHRALRTSWMWTVALGVPYAFVVR